MMMMGMIRARKRKTRPCEIRAERKQALEFFKFPAMIYRDFPLLPF